MMLKNNSIIDISWPISPVMTTYKDRGGVVFTPSKTYQNDGARETTITMPNHTGTHVDAPAHFLEHGTSIDHSDLSTLVGPCSVLDLSHITECITQADLAPFDIKPHSIILLKTSNSASTFTDRFNPSFIYLEQSGAQHLVNCNVATVGIDGLGIERNQPKHQTHSLLFNNAITIIEGLRLTNVNQGSYFLCCLPILLAGLDGAPARAILIKEDI